MKYWYLLFALALTVTSCDDLLDLKAPSELTASGFWDSENGALAAQSGLYGTLRGSHSTLWLLGAIRSDVWGGKTFESPSSLDLIESNINISNAPFGGWAGLYTNIHRVNDFIVNVPNVPFSQESDKGHLMGQAYGLRAFYYYTLLKTWGKVPLTTEPLATTDPAGLSRARASREEVMDQIKSDLEASLAAFGDDGSFWRGSRVYWSKAATLALKGDVYIWSGNLLGGGEADFREAQQALREVGTLDVSLLDDFADLWKIENENNKEFIFAIQYERDQATNFYDLMTGRSTEINPQYDSHGNSMADYIVNGGNRYGPSDKTLRLGNDTLDTRMDATFIRLYTDSNDGMGYPIFTPEKYFGSVQDKFSGSINGSVRIMDNDVPLYRYADVLLLLAEANTRLGEDPSEQINTVRMRAYGDAYDPGVQGYTNGSEEENIRAILHERYIEFLLEGKRWWDLRRAGNTYVFENVEYLEPGEEYLLELPITLDMIGRNPLLEQTENYVQ